METTTKHSNGMRKEDNRRMTIAVLTIVLILTPVCGTLLFLNHFRQLGLNEELYFAAGSGNLTSVEALLDAGAQVNFKWETGETPLGAAVRRKDYDMQRLLLSRGAHGQGVGKEEGGYD